MLNLAFIFHMHQPYYKNLLTGETPFPWVRLHGAKDYVDMVKILEKYPKIKQTFNVVPSLMEQVEDYSKEGTKDRFLDLSLKPAAALSNQEKQFILEHFFMIFKDRVIAVLPRYYELYVKKESKLEFATQDYLDLQVWFNLAWIDPYFRESIPELRKIVAKARFFNEDDKRIVLEKQIQILRDVIPTYRQFLKSGQIEISITPYYHPILPLLANTNIAREPNPKSLLPVDNFSYPQDALAQVEQAITFYRTHFADAPCGMWPSEEAVSEDILPMLIKAGIKWIVTDEAILFNSSRKKARNSKLLYRPHLLKRAGGSLQVIFRDRNLSDLIGFEYPKWNAKDAVADFMRHLANIHNAFKRKDILVTIAMDGENAWEYYANDGHDFLDLLYQNLSEAKFLRTTTVCEYLQTHPPKFQIEKLAAGSWIYGNFGKWIDNPLKSRAWEYLVYARRELDEPNTLGKDVDFALAWKQIYICEGSDWFWWYGEDPQGFFDTLFRMHLSNFYTIIGKPIPEYLKKPLSK